MSNKDVVTNEYSLLFGDCLERMKEIPSGSVDLILADPPYGTTKNKWDSTIDLDLMWSEIKRIRKNNAITLLFAQTPFDKVLGVSNLSELKYEWIWKKSRPTGRLNSKFAPMKEHENILIFSNGSACFVKNKENASPYYPQGLKPCFKINKRTKGTGNYDERNDKCENMAYFENYPKSILPFGVEVGLHPTQKPVALLEYLIKTYTNENEVVLDFTAGSFSTGVASLNTNRKFLGIEMDEKYFNIGVNRILGNKNPDNS